MQDHCYCVVFWAINRALSSCHDGASEKHAQDGLLGFAIGGAPIEMENLVSLYDPKEMGRSLSYMVHL